MLPFPSRPDVIDAIQLKRSPTALMDIMEFMQGADRAISILDNGLQITTKSETFFARTGDWVVKTDQGVFFCCPASDLPEGYKGPERRQNLWRRRQ